MFGDNIKREPDSRDPFKTNQGIDVICQLFESAADTSSCADRVNEPETAYALRKIRTLKEGVAENQLPNIVRKVIARIQEIDSEGYLFVGDLDSLCGALPSDPRRPLGMIWIPGTGKQLLESVEHWVHMASSRLNQKLDQQTSWFDAVRTVAVQAVTARALLMTADKVTGDEFVCRIGKLFRIPVVRFSPLPKVLDASWVRRQVDHSADAEVLRMGKPVQAYFRWLSTQPASDAKELVPAVAPLDADRLLASLATKMVVIAARRGGRVFAQTERRLQVRSGAGTRVLIDCDLTAKKHTDHFLDAGAVGWRLKADNDDGTSASVGRSVSGVACRRIDLATVRDDQFLIHWTRRRVGPWPDVSHDEYLDDLIFRSSRRRASELSALGRILASRAIIGANHLTRDRRSVVCFSLMTLAQMIAQRVFRAHLSRWDFEPYGIAFRPEVLQRRRAARPVIYGDDSDWAGLDDDQRPFFQQRRSKSGKIDWRLEKEWRVVGDVVLGQFGPDDAIVFVGQDADVDRIASLTVWPVVVLRD